METSPAHFRAAIYLLCRRHRASRFTRCRSEKTRQRVQSQKIQRPGYLLRQSAREIRAGIDGLVRRFCETPFRLACGRDTLQQSLLLARSRFGRPPLARCDRSWRFRSRPPHKLIKIKRAATFGSDFSKFDLVPAVHPIHLVAFLSDAHRCACDHAMDDLFVPGLWPTSHSAAAPINSVPDVVIGVGAFLEVEK